MPPAQANGSEEGAAAGRRARPAAHLGGLVETAPIGIGLLDLELRFAQVNAAFAALDGVPAGAHLGRAVADVLPGVRPDLEARLRRVLEAHEPLVHEELSGEASAPGGAQLHGEARHWLASFYPVRGAGGAVVGIGVTLQETTGRERAERRLAFQATHDALTGLPNRALFLDRLTVALARAERRPSPVAVLFLDLDGFKLVNDSLGHGAGDRLLVEVARRLRESVRPADTVARFGGDEFAVLCADLDSEREALRIARRVLAGLSRPVRLGAAELTTTPSVGVALSGGRGERPERLLRDADAAMYRAKRRGKARVELYDEDMRARAAEQAEAGRAVRHALRRDELRVVYQPIVAVADGSLAGAEALASWERPDGAVVPPTGLATLAEESGLASPIGAWLLGEACRQAAAWAAGPGGPLKVAVDLAAQLTQPGLVAQVGAILAEARVPPGLLRLELAESLLAGDTDAVAAALLALRGLGVTLAVDHFGTGWSSLTSLRHLPVDAIKVDRSFVADLGDDPRDTAIVAALTDLAHALGIQVAVEGVETAAQLAVLRRLGCDLAQGPHIGEPVAPGELRARP